ncbi:MAG: Holliday junction branch migration DNA helicase RuvB [Firmicutes bacterium]|jgi:Holliday junction DNA helicase RuvB|nr:Holliday junction branch migration DNA helicase RuvB [Bacillota bacterium]
MKDRIVSSRLKGEDVSHENNLRPLTLEEFIGQESLKEKMNIYIRAARERGETLDHVLLHGPPGLGKTTLAFIISREMGVNLRVTSGPAIERAGDLAALLTNLSSHDILFIDEIHRLHRSVEEILYPAMEDYALDIIIGKGPSARSLRLDLSPFTLIGATTRAGLISSPLRDRFGIVERVEFYSPEALCSILSRSARLMGVEMDRQGAMTIALASRGTPRIANRLLRRVRDFSQVRAEGAITAEVALEALKILDVDQIGLDATDYLLLNTIIKKFDGGPVGLETVAAAINEEASTIEELYEPYLMKIGFLKRTPRGRVVTRKVYEHLRLKNEFS